jgi:hypothetical protein
MDWSTTSIVNCVDFWPESLAIGIQTRLVGVDPLPTLILAVSLFPAENASHLVPVSVAPRIAGSPGCLILVVVTRIGLISVVVTIALCLAILLGLLLKFSQTVTSCLRHCLDTFVFFFWLDGMNLR